MADATVTTPSSIARAGTSDAEIEARLIAAKRRYGWVVAFWRLFILVAAFGSWELAARAGIIDVFFYSMPSAIFTRLWELVKDGDNGTPLWYHLAITMIESIQGFVLGSVGGIVVGIALGRNKLLSDIFSIYIKAFNAIPRVVLAPIFVFIFGLGMKSKVILSLVMVFFVVFANAFQGVREADRAMIANAQILGASRWQVTRFVILPSAMSWILASLHISFSFAIVGAIVGEFIGARAGVGLIMQTARGLQDEAGMYATILIIMTIVLVAEFFMTIIEHRLTKWRPAPFNDAGA